jgi:protein-tyrosine phosphatase
MIDIHTHLLPAVDDGSRTIEQSLEVLQRFADAGVTTVVCTPHLAASEAAVVPLDRYRKAHWELAERAPGSMTLQRGWEIMLDRPGIDLTSAHLRLGVSKAILVEFPHGPLPPGTTQELARLRQSGVVPVIAHPERYGGATIELVREWRQAGAVVQTDTAYLLGDGDKATLARGMLSEGLIDMLASDNHGDQRTLSAAEKWLVEIGATEAATLLTTTNPGRLLKDLAPVPVPPVRPDTGMFSRLRELIGLRRTPLRNTPIRPPTI